MTTPTLAPIADAEGRTRPARPATTVRVLPHPDLCPDGAEFSFLGDEVAYVFPSDDGMTCLGISLTLADYALARQDPERRFVERLLSHAGLTARVTVASGRPRAGPTAG